MIRAWAGLERVLAALGLLLVLISATPAVNWIARALAGPWTDSRAGVLIVLGGNSAPDGVVIGESSYWRAVYGVLAWKEGGFRQVVLSGGTSTVEPMKRFMVSEGVPEAAIRLESRSNSTRENALFTRQLLTDADTASGCVLLTSDYHMYRAWRAFRKAGLQTVPRPFPDAIKRGQTWRLRWGVFLDLALEGLKIAGYTARDWI